MVKKVEAEKANSLNQLEKFKRAARDVATDDREETFDRVLKRVARAPADKPTRRPPKQ